MGGIRIFFRADPGVRMEGMVWTSHACFNHMEKCSSWITDGGDKDILQG